MVQNHKAVIWNFDFFPNPPDGYLLAFQFSTGLWIPVNVPLGVNRNVHATIVFSASPYTILSSDDFIPVDSTGGVITINLPAAPLLGKGYTVTDQSGQAAINAITVAGNGHLIKGIASIPINIAYQTLTFVFNGLNWTVM